MHLYLYMMCMFQMCYHSVDCDITLECSGSIIGYEPRSLTFSWGQFRPGKPCKLETRHDLLHQQHGIQDTIVQWVFSAATSQGSKSRVPGSSKGRPGVLIPTSDGSTGVVSCEALFGRCTLCHPFRLKLSWCKLWISSMLQRGPMPPKDGSKDSLLAALTDFHLKFTFSHGLRMFKRGCWAKSGKGESKKTKKWTPVPCLPQEAGKFQNTDAQASHT